MSRGAPLHARATALALAFALAPALALSVGPAWAVSVAPVAPLSAGLYASAGATLDETLYLVGGVGPQRATHDAVWRFDPSDGTTTRVGTLPEPLFQGAAAGAAGAVYFFGGATAAALSSRDTYRFDPGTGEVSQVVGATFPAGIIGATAIPWRGSVLVAGGFTLPPTEDTWFDAVWRFDPARGTLEPQSVHLPSGRAYMAAATDGDKVWLFGGYGVDPARSCGLTVCTLRDVLEYDPQAQTLRVVAALPIPLRWATAAYHDGVVHLLGGCNGNCDAHGASDGIILYDPARREATATPLRLPERHGRAVLFQEGATAYVVGGIFEAAEGDRPLPGVARVTLGVTAPWAPADVALENRPDGVQVAWNASRYDGGRGPVTYTVLRAPVGGPLQALGSTRETSFLDRAAPFGTTVEYAVTATGGSGLASTPTAPRSITPVRVPGPPAGILAQGGDGKAILQWLPPEGSGGIGVRAYRVSCPACPEDMRALEVPGTRTSALLQPLPNGVRFTFQVRAVNDQGEGPPTREAAAVPGPVPDPPEALRADEDNGTILLDWSPPPGSTDIHGYRVFRGTALEDMRPIANTTVPRHVDQAPPGGVPLLYAVAALRNGNASPFSGVARAAVADLPAAPEAVWARLEGTGVLVGWTPSAADGGAPITGYDVRRDVDGDVQLLGIARMPPFVDPTPPAGARATYLVAAVNAAGASAFSASAPVDVPRGDGRTPPTAVLAVLPPAGDAATIFTFDASGSHDDEGVVAYRFDFGDGTSTGWTPSPVTQHRYPAPGEYAATLSVRDVLGTTSAQPAVKVVGVGRAAGPPDDVPPPPGRGGGIPAPGVLAMLAAAGAAGVAWRRRR